MNLLKLTESQALNDSVSSPSELVIFDEIQQAHLVIDHEYESLELQPLAQTDRSAEPSFDGIPTGYHWTAGVTDPDSLLRTGFDAVR